MAPTVQKLAFLFPGQGAQYAQMGSHLYANHSPTRELFAIADKVLGYKLSELILQGPEEKLKETEVTQPALLTVSVATGRYLLEQGIKPQVMAGHSLGEYSALVVAESLDFAEAVRLTQLRGRYMQQAVPMGVGTMAAILGLEDQLVENLCARVRQNDGAKPNTSIVEPAGYNCPGQVVVAGEVAAVERLMELAKSEGGKCIPLKVSAPFHCSMLKPAAEKMAEEFKKVKFSAPKIPYFANVDAMMVGNAAEIAHKLTEQIVKPVCWSQTLTNMLLMNVQRFIEVGPGKVCIGHLKKVERRKSPRAAAFAVTDKEADLKNVLEVFAKEFGLLDKAS
jgi:[acyl-carrier-protein] S-malonyltransferase